MSSKDIERKIKDNNEDIAVENKKIERANKKLSEISNEQDKKKYYDKIRESQIYICELEKENEEGKLQIRKTEIQTMKDYLDEKKENGEISEEEYMDKYTSLRIYSKVQELAAQIKILDIDARKDDAISGKDTLRKEDQDRYKEASKQNQKEILDKQKLLAKNIKKFKTRNLDNQYKQGVISEQEYNNAKKDLENKNFSIEDVEDLSKDLDIMESDKTTLQSKTNQEKFEEYMKDTNPKTEVLETIEIDDEETKKELKDSKSPNEHIQSKSDDEYDEEYDDFEDLYNSDEEENLNFDDIKEFKKKFSNENPDIEIEYFDDIEFEAKDMAEIEPDIELVGKVEQVERKNKEIESFKGF